MQKITLDPMSRIEGHMKVEVVIDGGEVKGARCEGTLFRGFEQFMVGRSPLDASRLLQRVCGVCPIVHATAANLNLDSAFGVADRVPENGRIMRNLILASNFLQSHILHFYALAALDYVDVTALADYDGSEPDLTAVKRFLARSEFGPFFPRYEGDYRLNKEQNRELVAHYVQALRMRALAHEAGAIFGGKMPHEVGIIPGGVITPPTIDKIAALHWKINTIREFIDNTYLPDVITIAKVYPDHFHIGRGCERFLSYGTFELETKEADLTKRARFLPRGAVSKGTLSPVDMSLVREEVAFSRYSDDSGGGPADAHTEPVPDKQSAYSWIKAPRYGGEVYEVGPLARMMAGYHGADEKVKTAVGKLLADTGGKPEELNSVLGRHAARALDAKLVADAAAGWATELKPGEPHCVPFEIPRNGRGMGIVDGPRGALGHWMEIEDYKIKRYQLVVPSTWNISPRDSNGQPGPLEQALIGAKVKDVENPFEVVRIVRSFDPCLACAVHVMTARGAKLGVYRVA